MAMERRLSPVRIETLHWQDQSFAIHSYTRSAFLSESLKRHGVLSPPWLLQTDEGRPVIVDGYKRLRWLEENRATEVECLLFAASCDRRELLIQRLEVKMAGASVNLAEKAQIVARLAEMMPPERVLADYFPVLNLASRPQAIDRWSRLAAAEKFLLSALANDRLCERVALELIDWPSAEIQRMIALFCELRCSASIQMEIAERIGEIALSQGKGRAEIVDSREVQDILQDADRHHRRKTQDLRDLLQRWRFPRLSARQQRFQRNLDACGLPAPIRILPPPDFEGNSWQLQIQFSSPAELPKLLASVQVLAVSSKFPELLEQPVNDEVTAANPASSKP
jgi:hypothetical protein